MGVEWDDMSNLFPTVGVMLFGVPALDVANAPYRLLLSSIVLLFSRRGD